MPTFIMKHPGSCTGMYWRHPPAKGGSFAGPPDWPRNGSIMKGNVHEFPEKPMGSFKWLEVEEYQAAGKTGFVEVEKGKIWMQFEQEGVLLHPVE